MEADVDDVADAVPNELVLWVAGRGVLKRPRDELIAGCPKRLAFGVIEQLALTGPVTGDLTGAPNGLTALGAGGGLPERPWAGTRGWPKRPPVLLVAPKPVNGALWFG